MRSLGTYLASRFKPPARRRSGVGIAALATLAAFAVALRIMPQTPPAITFDSQAFGSPPDEPVQPAPRPTELVTFDQGCVSAECHAAYELSQDVHAPVYEQECNACHENDQGDHTYPLFKPIDTLCADCHDTGHTATIRHEVLDNEGCLACHDAHDSPFEFLLVRQSIEETCEQCHPPHEGVSQHQPYEQGRCGACHEPHESDYKGLLRGGQGSDHCTSCHEQIAHITATSVYTHSVVENGCFG